MKQCSVCKNVLKIDNFYKDKTKSDGHAPQCKNCRKEKDKRNYDEKRTDFLEYKKKHYNKNKDKYSLKNRRYYVHRIRKKSGQKVFVQ